MGKFRFQDNRRTSRFGLCSGARETPVNKRNLLIVVVTWPHNHVAVIITWLQTAQNGASVDTFRSSCLLGCILFLHTGELSPSAIKDCILFALFCLLIVSGAYLCNESLFCLLFETIQIRNSRYVWSNETESSSYKTPTFLVKHV